MRVLYDISIWFLGLYLFIGGIFHKKIRKRWKLQRKWKTFLPQDPVDVWMHCASLGEFDQALPLLWEYRNNFPSSRIMVSFFSPSGFEHFHKRKHCVDVACVLPLDTRKNARYFLAKTQPKTVIFIKYEFWLNMIFAVQKERIPLFSAAALFRKNQLVFRPWGSIFQHAFKGFSHFFVQTETSKLLLNRIGISQVSVVGDPRYDNVTLQKLTRPQTEDKNLLILINICENKRVLVVGSSWQDEEEMLHGVLDSLPFDRIVLAPHDISPGHLYDIETLFGEDCHRFSQMELYRNERIILVDCIGLLNHLYHLGSLAIVGGGFSGNLHNILEPAIYGLPIIFGPKHHRFPEARLFIERGIAASFSNSDELLLAASELMKAHEQSKERTLQFMEEQCGATKKIMEFLLNRPSHHDVPSN